MTAANQGYKHTLSRAGNVQNRSPGSFSRTPANIIAGSTVYTAGQLATVSVNDLNFVQNSFAVPVTTTGRSSHMFEFDVPFPSLLTAIANLVNFGHLIGAVATTHQIRAYIWNAVTLARVLLSTSTSNADPRTMTGAITSDFADFVDGLGKLYVLIWDYEGVFLAGGGGCVHESTLIHTLTGPVLIGDVRIGSMVIGWENGVLVADRAVDEITCHYNRDRNLVRITTVLGEILLTENHTIPTPSGNKEATHITTDDEVMSMTGQWLRIDTVEHFVERCNVYDIITRAPCFFVAGGLAVNVDY